jgi:hypothetical protein
VGEGLARLVVILGALMVTPIYFLNTINDAVIAAARPWGRFPLRLDKPRRDALVLVFL